MFIVLSVKGGGNISKRDSQITYIFENPNQTKDLERVLQQIIVEKLLQLRDMRRDMVE